MRGAFQTVKYNQVEDSRNKSQIEQGYEINNDSQSDIAHFVSTLLIGSNYTSLFFDVNCHDIKFLALLCCDFTENKNV